MPSWKKFNNISTSNIKNYEKWLKRELPDEDFRLKENQDNVLYIKIDNPHSRLKMFFKLLHLKEEPELTDYLDRSETISCCLVRKETMENKSIIQSDDLKK